jgi:hypothetical protein
VCKLIAQPRQIFQSSLQVAQVVHHIEAREVGDAVGAQAHFVPQPFAQRAMPRGRRLIHAAPRPALRFRAAAAQQAFAFQLLERGIYLAQLGGPEIVNALVEESFQVVAAGGFAEQAEQDVVQAHAFTI